jgi:hypothetical protein
VDDGVLEEKFMELVGARFGAETARRGLNAAHSIETCGDMAKVFCDVLPA